MIRATNLTKKYHHIIAVDSINLNVSHSKIFGLLGPNAAGKTTTIRMLCGIIRSDEGQIQINGMPVDKAKTDFGYVAQYFGQYEELSVWENLKFYARMYNVVDEKRLLNLLDRYDLMQFKNRMAGFLSGGYKRRLALVCALAHDPKVLFLDEPTAGIDPVTRKLLWDDFYALSAEGKTLFVTTHYMEEAQRCHQLAFISSGKLVGEGSPDSIKKSMGDVSVYITKMSYSPKIREALIALAGMILVNQFGDELRIVVAPYVTKTVLENIITSISKYPVSLEFSEPNLEDVFIALTQKQALFQ